MVNYMIIKIHRRDLVRLVRREGLQVRILKQEDDYLHIRFPFSFREELKRVSYEITGYEGPIRYYYALKRNVPILVGLFIFTFFLFIHSKSIQSIEFNAETKHNDAISKIITSHYRKVLWLNFLDSDLNQVNFALRREFTEFEWIDVRKEGTVLKVTILEPNIINKRVVKREGYGDLVARESGFITGFHVRQGVVVVTELQYVKKGDLLVSGNLNIKRPDREPFLIPAEGKVMAKVHREKTIEVLKEEVVTEYTGKISTDTYFSLFGLNIPLKTKGHSYDEYDKTENVDTIKIFNLKLPFGLKKVHYYEKNDIIRLYDDRNALLYAESMIHYELNQMLEENDELIDLLLLRQEETEDRYIYHFLIVTNENIAEFKRSHADE